jgi:hypothetical protein
VLVRSSVGVVFRDQSKVRILWSSCHPSPKIKYSSKRCTNYDNIIQQGSLAAPTETMISDF